MTAAEVQLAILVARGIVAAGTAIYQAIVGDETEAELLERARVAGIALPVHGGPDTEWAADTVERLARGGVPIDERETLALASEPVPSNPYYGDGETE